MPLLTNIGALARCLPSGPQSEIHVIPAAALAWEGDRIAWVGPEAELPERFRDWPREDAGGRLVVPGLVDSHTHLAFGGWRAGEFEQRLLGKSYLEIAGAGRRRRWRPPARRAARRCWPAAASISPAWRGSASPRSRPRAGTGSPRSR